MAIKSSIISFWKQVKLKSSDMFTQFRVGVGVKVPTHKLHVKDSTDPVKIEGLQNDATDPDKFLTIDSSNIVKYRTGAQVLTDIGGTPLTAEQVQDLVGAMFSSNTETRVTATYQDADGTIDLVVDDMTADTNTNLGNTNLTQDDTRTLTGNGNDLIFTGQGRIVTNSELNIKNGTEAPNIQIYEASGSGTNYITLTCAALASNTTLTMPNTTGTIALTSNIPTGNSIIDWTGASAGTIHSSNYTDTNTNIANTDLTITGSRTLNMDGDDLTFSGVAAFTVQGESIFEGRIAITNGSSAPELKLREPSGGGSSSGILTVGALSADKTYTFPDATGTVALTSSNITGTAAGLSSTLSVASGGTGATSFADKAVIITQDSGTDTLAAVTMSTNGQLLIGGTDGPAVATLTQGSGLTITNANGGITIAVDGDIDTTGESGSVENIGNLTGDVTSSNRATTIANDAVTYAKMQNVSATNVVLGRDSAGAGVVEEISAANLRTILNVADGATADQTNVTGSSGSCTGNAATATALATTRALQVTLTETDSANFDGSAAVTDIGVTGILAVGNGGTGRNTLAANSLLTGNGTSAITPESNLTYDGTNLTMTSDAIAAPDLIIQSTVSHPTAGNLVFNKFRDDDTPPDGMMVGLIQWNSEDDANNTQIYAQIIGSAEETGSGSEGGKLQLKIATHDGELQDGIVIEDGNAEDEIDVTIGQGASSLTTIAGNLDVTGNVLPGITYVKILPSDFVPDDVGRPAMIDDTSSDRWLESHGTAKLFAYVDIPVGFKATHVDVYGSATSAVTVYEADVNSKTVTSKGTGNIGTQIDITDVNSDATNYILIELAQASGEEVYGGKLTIAKI